MALAGNIIIVKPGMAYSKIEEGSVSLEESSYDSGIKIGDGLGSARVVYEILMPPPFKDTSHQTNQIAIILEGQYNSSFTMLIENEDPHVISEPDDGTVSYFVYNGDNISGLLTNIKDEKDNVVDSILEIEFQVGSITAYLDLREIIIQYEYLEVDTDILERFHDAYSASKDYKIEFMNKELIKHIGHDATGANCYELLHGFSDNCPWYRGNKVLSGEIINFEHKSPKNNRWYYYLASPMSDSEGKISGQQVIAIDINDRKISEQTLAESHKKLQLENKLLKSRNINRYGLDNILGQSKKMQEI